MTINWRNKTIVRFKTGWYGVRRGWFVYKYFDTNDKKWWHRRHASNGHHYDAVEWFNYKDPRKDWGTPVSIIPPPPECYKP